MTGSSMPVTPAYRAQEQAAVDHLLSLGVVMGEPVALSAGQRAFGHTMCAFHLIETATGGDVDGAAASTIVSLLTNGTYGGKPTDYTLVPCLRDPA